MSQTLKPAPVTFSAAEIKPDWIDSVRGAIAEGDRDHRGARHAWQLRASGCRLEARSDATPAWHAFGPTFTTPADAAQILAVLVAGLPS